MTSGAMVLSTRESRGLAWADATKPVPFAHAVFLLTCGLAGTCELDRKAFDVLAADDPVTLRREKTDAEHPKAVSVRTADGTVLGWLPVHIGTAAARLLDAGKRLTAKVAAKEVVCDRYLDVRVGITLEEF